MASWTANSGAWFRSRKIADYKGLWFATFDPHAPSLREYLGEMTWYLDAFFDRREGGVEVIGGIHKWIVPCNWKFPAENFAGDGYHVQWSHLSAVRTGSGGDFRVKPDPGGRALSPASRRPKRPSSCCRVNPTAPTP